MRGPGGGEEKVDKEEESRKSRKKLVIHFFYKHSTSTHPLTHFYECTHTSYHYKHFRKTGYILRLTKSPLKE